MINLPRRDWRWMWVRRWVGVYAARSSDGVWDYKGRRLRWLDATAQRCGPSGRAISLGLIVGEFSLSLVIDPGKFREEGKKYMSEQQKIEMGKTYRTRDGRVVRLLCVDGPNPEYPVVGFVVGEALISTWTAKGCMWMGHEGGQCDLIEVKPKRRLKRWANVYPDGRLYLHTSKSDADETDVRDRRIACLLIDIEFEEGQGL